MRHCKKCARKSYEARKNILFPWESKILDYLLLMFLKHWTLVWILIMIINIIMHSHWSYLPYRGSNTTDYAYGKFPDDCSGTRIKPYGHCHLLGFYMKIWKIVMLWCEPDMKVYNPTSNNHIQ